MTEHNEKQAGTDTKTAQPAEQPDDQKLLTQAATSETKPASASDSKEPAKSEAEPPTGAGNNSGEHSRKRSGRGLFVTLILLVLIAALAYVTWEQQLVLQSLTEQEAEDQGWQDELAALRTQLSDEQAALAADLQQQNEAQSGLERLLAAQQQRQDELDERLLHISERVATVDSSARPEAWMLVEVEGLLRLAQQRLLVAEDQRGALAMFVAADEILRDMDDSRIASVRAALATDITALRGVDEIDIQGRYARLNALLTRLPSLPLRDRLAEQLNDGERLALTGNEQVNWLDKALAGLSQLVSVRRLDAPLQGMLSAEQDFYLRQNITLLLEQAQLALWRGDETVYRSALARAIDYLGRYYQQDDSAVRSTINELDDLREQAVVRVLPPAGAGLAALRRVINSMEGGL